MGATNLALVTQTFIGSPLAASPVLGAVEAEQRDDPAADAVDEPRALGEHLRSRCESRSLTEPCQVHMATITVQANSPVTL